MGPGLFTMHAITDSEVDYWLRQRSIPARPYSGRVAPGFSLQFSPPSTTPRLDAFVRHYYGRIIPDSDSLVHLTDWSLYQESEMIAMQGIRSGQGEVRNLIQSPGHVLDHGERELGIALFSLSASFGWSSYLYANPGHATLYNWEGDLFDFWTDYPVALAEMKLILREFDLRETKG